MSISFTANQYDQEFTPKRLNMYEIPKQTLAKPPSVKSSTTNFIANNNGHLLAGTSKGESNPFGDFVGTWDLPKKIPGPYQINPTGRSTKNVEGLKSKKNATEDAIKAAQDAQKPVSLQRNKSYTQINHNADAAFDKIISESPNQGFDTQRSNESNNDQY